MWKRSSRARLASKTESWRCENDALVGDLPQKQKVDVKTTLSYETCVKNRKSKMWKRSSRTRPASKTKCWCENEALVPDLPQKLRVEDAKTTLSYETCVKNRKLKMWKWSSRTRLASKTECWRCENDALVRDLPQKLRVEDVKTKLSCDDIPQKRKGEDVKMKFSCDDIPQKLRDEAVTIIAVTPIALTVIAVAKNPVTIPVTSVAVTSNDP